jgi:hypothetical protein
MKKEERLYERKGARVNSIFLVQLRKSGAKDFADRRALRKTSDRDSGAQGLCLSGD